MAFFVALYCQMRGGNAPTLAFIACLLAGYVAGGQARVVPGTEAILHSPNGQLTVTVYQRETDSGRRHLYYHVEHGHQPVVLESGLAIEVDNHLLELAMAYPVGHYANWCDDLLVKSLATTEHDTTWVPLYGERSRIRDHYRQVELALEKADNAKYRLHLQVRVYDEGVAFRYYFPEHLGGMYYHITAENDEFTLPEGTQAYFTNWAQGPYAVRPLRDWPDQSERPLTLALPGGLYASLCEAGLTDYARTKFALSAEKPNTVVTALYGAVDALPPLRTPWRTILIGEKPGELLEHNYLLLNLSEPTKLRDANWIKPGKIMRDMVQTTESAKACVDFAAAHGLQYILFDAKWYGPEYLTTSDATQVKAGLDMPAVIEYGREKGIGIWLYVNQKALARQLDELLPLYRKWGVKGVKFGFVQVGSQGWTMWLTQAVQKAMDNGLLVNIHDEYRPTGTSRTYPNLLNQEGVRGNEEMPDATNNVVQAYTRYLAGAADYTICYYSPRLKTTHAHQLALGAVYYAPLQTLFWYDKPSDYQGEPEVEFFEKVPTTWDETRVVQGEIGQYISVARRKGPDWFVGTITNTEGRTLRLTLDFLPKNQVFMASIYADDARLTTRTKVSISHQKVKAGQTLNVPLLPSGGQAIWLTPVK